MLRLCGRPRAQALRGAGVKLLLDENLSDRIISRVADLFPDSTHFKAVGLREAEDFVVWEWAKKHGFTIVSNLERFSHSPGSPLSRYSSSCRTFCPLTIA